ncbi:MAG TPA: DUF3653 domain-containing protein [Pseudoxanthomonas sp.]|nr:DUF3653 domain-containing protein [Pseudoxanthomonas sp.]
MHLDLDGEWYGWKQRGRYLVSPEGDKLTLERMKGIVWRLEMEANVAKARNARKQKNEIQRGQHKVVIVDLADWHSERFGNQAG